MLEKWKTYRSIRKFDPEPPKDDVLRELMGTVLIAPSSRGRRPWEFVVVKDKAVLEELSKAKESGSAFLKDSPVAVVVLADPSISDVWIEDCSIAAYTIQTCAREFGLGSCWVQIRSRKGGVGCPSEEVVRKVLHVPSSLAVECIIALGYPGEEKRPYTEEDMDWPKVHEDRY